MTNKARISKLLVANRGEIAVRIIRTAHRMGFATVAVYSSADAESEHVRLADEAVCIGAPAPAESYLRIDAVIGAARQTGADAIHPGYGFLAENPALPEACEKAGIIFVGPSAAAISSMGDKAGAKKIMMEAGVPCVPGYQGMDQSLENLSVEADKIGFPVMIKATAGGGGRGMRLVASATSFEDELESAKSEAKGAFGNDIVLLEKAIINPRHIEIQIMADRHGNVIHCGERDCSVQRRHQKVIEEAPSPAVDAPLREKMGAASIAAVKAIGYVGAGTFEYLLDDAGQFYFMEMNTRLQVEHPVTELVTGLDLVELQLKVAMGEVLPLSQENVVVTGHAMEVRLCAEDAGAGFVPQSGMLTVWEPASRVRVDHGLRSGSVISPYYDSMIAKIIAYGDSRDAARRKLISALGETVAFGIQTNKDFLGDCLSHHVFADGGATTAFIETYYDDLFETAGLQEARAAMVAAALLRGNPGTSLAHGYRAPLRLMINGTDYEPAVSVTRDGKCHVEMDGKPPLLLQLISKSCDCATITLDGVTCTIRFRQDQSGIAFHLGGRSYEFQDLTYQPIVTVGAVGSDGKVRASMNGNVVSVDVVVGDRVEKGQRLVVVEAMKMEHSHVSELEGTVKVVNVDMGMQVSVHSILLEIEGE